MNLDELPREVKPVAGREVTLMAEENTMRLLLKMTLNNPKLPTRAVVNVLKDVMPILFYPHIEKVEIVPIVEQTET